MALFGPHFKAGWAWPRHSIGGVVAALALSVLLFPLLSGGANSPGTGVQFERPRPTATLTRSGDELIVTGSVAALFNTGVFSGPNVTQKVNRARLTPDGSTVSSGFESVRTRLAEERARQAGGNPDPVATASIGPITENQALGAIDTAMPPNLAPMPATMSQTLAYSRAELPATDFSILRDKSGHEVSEKEFWCMAVAIYFEARGESYRGQIAVGQVVMNRVAHRLYPDTICNVVFQNQHMRNACQFSFACDGVPETITEPGPWAQAREIATGIINGTLYLAEVANATHYHATYVYPDWAPRLKKVTKIDHHIFYRFKRA